MTKSKPYTVECKACGGTQVKVWHTSDLGRTADYIVRWCACPTDQLITDPAPEGRKEHGS